MKKKRVSKAGLAKMLRTSRAQVNRLLDPASDVTVSSLQRAAALVGRRLRLEVV
jgi:antitoxin HicB